MHTARLWGGNWHKGESFRGEYKEVKEYKLPTIRWKSKVQYGDYS